MKSKCLHHSGSIKKKGSGQISFIEGNYCLPLLNTEAEVRLMILISFYHIISAYRAPLIYFACIHIFSLPNYYWYKYGNISHTALCKFLCGIPGLAIISIDLAVNLLSLNWNAPLTFPLVA